MKLSCLIPREKKKKALTKKLKQQQQNQNTRKVLLPCKKENLYHHDSSQHQYAPFQDRGVVSNCALEQPSSVCGPSLSTIKAQF